jgi:DNA-binding transcriptional LysR family regulator
MNLRQLRAIQAVAELGSVTAAANRLRLTQSAVSRMIASFEAELGLNLFERYRKRLLLSDHAAPLIAKAEKIVGELQDLEAGARAIRQGRTDRLQVIAVPPFLQRIIPAAIAERLSANPRLSVKLEMARRLDIPDWINRRDFDVAVIGLPVDRPEVEIQPLPPVQAVAVLPQGHCLAGLKRVSLRQVYSSQAVVHSTGPLMRFELDRALAGRGWPLSAAVEAPSAWLVCAMVMAGAGAAVVDPFTAAALANSQLVVRPLRERITLRYGIMTLRERPLVGEAAALVQKIFEHVSAALQNPGATKRIKILAPQPRR